MAQLPLSILPSPAPLSGKGPASFHCQFPGAAGQLPRFPLSLRFFSGLLLDEEEFDPNAMHFGMAGYDRPASGDFSVSAHAVGTVLSVDASVITIGGISNSNCVSGGLVYLMDPLGQSIPGASAMVLNINEGTVQAILLGSELGEISAGCLVSSSRDSFLTFRASAGTLLSRQIDALGNPIAPIAPLPSDVSSYGCDISVDLSPERPAPGILDRKSIDRPMQTGLKVVDTLFPIGRGQRELIIGDRQTGKTTVAIDSMLGQSRLTETAIGDDPVVCVYVAVGQKNSTVHKVREVLVRHNSHHHTVLVSASASDTAAMQFLAPYTGCSAAEFFRDLGKDVLIVYDDLSKQAVAYRQLSLILRRPPGREAYPGDVFYLHSRLLERACQLSDTLGGGSLTALPIVETQAGDISAYIPTNVISITDGQIFLESELFHQGIRPAVNVGLSVSRVGSKAQVKPMRLLSSRFKTDIAQYNEMLAFARFGGDLDQETRSLLARGARLVELFKQSPHSPYTVEEEILVLLAASLGHFSAILPSRVSSVESALLHFFRTNSVGRAILPFAATDYQRTAQLLGYFFSSFFTRRGLEYLLRNYRP